MGEILSRFASVPSTKARPRPAARMTRSGEACIGRSWRERRAASSAASWFLGGELCHQRIGEFVIAVNILHVVMFIERIEQSYQGLAGIIADRRHRLRPPFDFRRMRRAELCLQG